ncbi:MAG: DUF3124 domain-containing protein [Cyanobacteria bacterium]|nr:DUF3124 domain-containing protein [Cyanobacteria bacterium CG_2015-16_32_12]NCQ05941.1 DUF3124 domain-containing protein [Cyanobacteria bacterium CG_2015-09_32_10]NCQ43333.1 DUF3124 domain-containing protein [Cyanobacteria bacterium CG_2015-04_32_10]
MSKKYLFCFLLLISFFFFACDSTQTLNNQPTNITNNKNPINTETINLSPDFKPITGQIIYIPVYSNIYHSNQQRSHNLAVTVSFHNIDLDNSIIIKSVKYYDTQGNLIDDYLASPVTLKPLASTNFYIEDSDIRGGIGANFLMEWVADKKVVKPFAESVMISTASTQGISFTSQGRIVKEF